MQSFVTQLCRPRMKTGVSVHALNNDEKIKALMAGSVSALDPFPYVHMQLKH